MANLKRAIGQITDANELRELKRAIEERIRLLANRAYAEKCAAKWESIKGLPIGTVLYVCAAGTFFGGPFQRGDSFKLSYIKPRKRVIWIEHKGEQFGYWFGVDGMTRYDLRTTPPENAMPAEERQRVTRMANRILGTDTTQMVAA